MQLLYEENADIRPYSEIVKDIPFRAVKSIGTTIGLGSLLTAGSSFFVFRKLQVAKNDLKVALPVLTSFSAIDFTVNMALTRLTGKRTPERYMSVISGGVAGGAVGYIYGKGMPRPTIGGAIAGLVYGYVRNWPLDTLGLDRF
jgi:hypothetical protein